MDAVSKLQLSHREAIEKLIATGEYNPLSHRESVMSAVFGEEEVAPPPEREVGVAKPEVWTQPIGEVWPPGRYGVSIHGGTPRVVRFR